MSDFTTAIITALGLVLVIEGAIYALFPEDMKRMMRVALAQPSGRLRMAGLAAATVGVVVVLLVR
jgi:uncharacterized protein YjeT (DUF2065 family)